MGGGDAELVGADLLVLGEDLGGFWGWVVDCGGLVGEDGFSELLGFAGDDDDREVGGIDVLADRGVDLVEGHGVEGGGEALEVGLAVEAVELVVDGVAQPLGGGVGEVQDVLAQEVAGELELLLGEALVGELLELAVGGSEGEVSVLVGEGSDPDLE
ncbi:hypothetical protein ENSA7_82430 [Enhygromyxa salina]|uniref:Uncharacterized protein n=1 Tax=Enhygromyxa salina TaxID=215803 RepID=A0A2S9XC58_9BACT|nr:hypothetical protein ENSA7_82430 [Enhygromyxa salina]